ncbi:MAG: 3-hydroxyacyl-CoA dehydrogenase [Alphaproteobacteria bacterium]|nr:3-hydroxyacyl-CoA dehydrogenase [Alphaproteobacteria bacterium]
MPLAAPENLSHVAVIGAGTVGSSWATFFLARGLGVTVWDPAAGFETRVNAYIERAWPVMERLGLAAKADPTRVRFAQTPVKAITGTPFVQESAPEDMAIKRALYTELDGALGPDAVLASSSSGLLISELQRGWNSAPRMVIGHPFNPPHLIPLVEVVGGPETDPAVVDWTIAFYKALGKPAIRLNREVTGHVANRLQSALWREAVHLITTGVASAADVDTAIAYGPGLRWALMGQTMVWHLGGGDGGMARMFEILGPAIQSWWDDLGAPNLTPEVKAKMVAEANASADGQSIADIARRRDELLIGLIETLGTIRDRLGPGMP